MIPPLIRTGPPPPPNRINQKIGYVVLVQHRGWCIAKWYRNGGILIDTDQSLPEPRRVIHPNHILCWMPEDGS